LADSLASLRINDGAASVSPSFIYCDNERQITRLVQHIDSLLSTTANKIPVFLDCEGRDLGRIDGKLGLVQLGVEAEVYLIDVIDFPGCFPFLKTILENPNLEKIMWDGRSDYSELWHGHDISIKPVIDLQLVHVYESTGGRPGREGYIMLKGMTKTFQSLPMWTRKDSEIDHERLKRSNSCWNNHTKHSSRCD
jgi:3'-5' exonuclease